MLDPLLSLALTMQSSPGVYALLLGSGVSRAAAIPTGWEIVLDLVEKLAALEGDDAGPDLEAWYTTKYGHEPTYSELLAAVGNSQAERSQLLKGYFEPNDDDRENGRKLPTAAHKSVAELVKLGVVKVIITTNFDRLIEQALRSEGIEPMVIASANDAAGMMPLAHSNCVVIKLHGDYLDLRTRNTPMELDEYEQEIDDLLDRVIDEYGLVICGWSAQWDTALRNAIARAKGRRFSTFWTKISDLTEAGERLVQHRAAEVIHIEGADSFFTDVAEKVRVLNDLQSPHPLSIQAAISQTKRYLADPNGHIRLSDLLMGEVERIIEETGSTRFPVNSGFDESDAHRRIAQFEPICALAIGVIATGCYWGQPAHHKIWVQAIQRLLNRDRERDGYVLYLGLQLYPALLVQYAAGIGAAAAGKTAELFKILSEPQRHENSAEPFAPADLDECVDGRLFRDLRDVPGDIVARSRHIYSALRPFLKDIIPSDSEYSMAFDTFETLQALEMIHRTGRAAPSRFMKRYYFIRDGGRVTQVDGAPLIKLEEAVNRSGALSTFLQHGFLGGSDGNFRLAVSNLDKMIAQIEMR